MDALSTLITKTRPVGLATISPVPKRREPILAAWQASSCKCCSDCWWNSYWKEWRNAERQKEKELRGIPEQEDPKAPYDESAVLPEISG